MDFNRIMAISRYENWQRERLLLIEHHQKMRRLWSAFWMCLYLVATIGVFLLLFAHKLKEP